MAIILMGEQRARTVTQRFVQWAYGTVVTIVETGSLLKLHSVEIWMKKYVSIDVEVEQVEWSFGNGKSSFEGIWANPSPLHPINGRYFDGGRPKNPSCQHPVTFLWKFSKEWVCYPPHRPRRTGAMGTANSPTSSYTSASIEEAEASHARLPRRHRQPTRARNQVVHTRVPCKDEEEEQPGMPALGNSAEDEAGAGERGRWVSE
ncbi:hypothetical protein K438DRAFT_1775601 [Mycena galopus ATCC 62051]|nr:hypothetical protein K438DRAFT_1775601 [Mycena galopus ATCC 62051]